MNPDAGFFHLMAAGLVLLAVLLSGLAFLWLRDLRRNRAAERQWHRSQQETVPQPAFSEASLPEWDGDTYAYQQEWPETGLARYLGMSATAAQPVLRDYAPPRYAAMPSLVPTGGYPSFTPASQVSGPFHAMAPGSDTEDFIARMQAEATEFRRQMRAETAGVLAYLRSPLEDGTEPGAAGFPG